MSNYAVGHLAEKYAARWLRTQGHQIVGLNWKTPLCEIDVITHKAGVVYFVEVKYRKNDFHGSGLDYVTVKKQARMQFAAEMWLQNHGWKGDYTLAAIELSGTDFRVVNFVDEL